MANTSEEPVADGKRFKPDTLRIVILALFAGGIYGSGVLEAMWAANLSIKAAHAGQPIPVWPWALAFAIVIAGILSVIYGFFFRPRELRLSESQVAVVYWDGNGKKIRRDQVTRVESGGRRIVLRGPEKTLVIARIFRDWDRIKSELDGWGKPGA
jgi:hypothetical protein